MDDDLREQKSAPGATMTHTVAHASALGDAAAPQIARVFAESFGQDFAAFARTPEILAAAFEHAFVTELFWVAVNDSGEIVGAAALSDGIQPSLVFRGRELRRHLGLLRGTLASVVLSRVFSHPIPDANPTTGSIEFVGTATAHRGRGIATAIIEQLVSSGQYRDYVLAEVADNNVTALRLYERLGFREYHRRPLRFSGGTGIAAYISLRRETAGSDEPPPPPGRVLKAHRHPRDAPVLASHSVPAHQAHDNAIYDKPNAPREHSGAEVHTASEQTNKAARPNKAARRKASRLRAIGRFLADWLCPVFQDEIGDRIDQFPEYRKARMEALQLTALRNFNR